MEQKIEDYLESTLDCWYADYTQEADCSYWEKEFCFESEMAHYLTGKHYYKNDDFELIISETTIPILEREV